jgi:hypothetical protein
MVVPISGSLESMASGLFTVIICPNLIISEHSLRDASEFYLVASSNHSPEAKKYWSLAGGERLAALCIFW